MDKRALCFLWGYPTSIKYIVSAKTISGRETSDITAWPGIYPYKPQSWQLFFKLYAINFRLNLFKKLLFFDEEILISPSSIGWAVKKSILNFQTFFMEPTSSCFLLSLTENQNRDRIHKVFLSNSQLCKYFMVYVTKCFKQLNILLFYNWRNLQFGVKKYF